MSFSPQIGKWFDGWEIQHHCLKSIHLNHGNVINLPREESVIQSQILVTIQTFVMSAMKVVQGSWKRVKLVQVFTPGLVKLASLKLVVEFKPDRILSHPIRSQFLMYFSHSNSKDHENYCQSSWQSKNPYFTLLKLLPPSYDKWNFLKSSHHFLHH